MSHLRVVIVQGSWRTSVTSRVAEELLHHISKLIQLLYLNDKITEIQGLGKQEQPSSWNLSSHPWLPRQKMPPDRCQAQMYTSLGKEIQKEGQKDPVDVFSEQMPKTKDAASLQALRSWALRDTVVLE